MKTCDGPKLVKAKCSHNSPSRSKNICKVVIAQELNDRNRDDFETWKRLCQDILGKMRPKDVILFSNKANFNLSGATNKISDTGLKTTH